jgi:hypothetical protein
VRAPSEQDGRSGKKVTDEKAMVSKLVPPLPPGLPVPSLDPHDLSGAWIHDQPLEPIADHDMYDNPPPYNPRGHKLLARRVMSHRIGKPYANAASKCRPPGVLVQQEIAFPFLILQSKDQIHVLFQDYHGRQIIYLSPAKPPKGQANYMGDSFGHWEGDTLVVVTKGMKNPIQLDPLGSPSSPSAVITQRIRKVHQNQWFLEITTTIDDPVYYTHPWSFVRTFGWRPNMELLGEYDCETQVGDKSVSQDAGLVAEPPEDLH